MADYPNPCDKCSRKETDNCNNYRKCQKWLTRYRYRQKQINGYAKKVLPDYEERQRKWRVEYDVS